MAESESLLKILRKYFCIGMVRNRGVIFIALYLYFNILVCFDLGIIPPLLSIKEPAVSATRTGTGQSHPYYSYSYTSNRGQGQSQGQGQSSSNNPVRMPVPVSENHWYSHSQKQGADYEQFQKFLRAQLKSGDKFEADGSTKSNRRAEEEGGHHGGGGGWGWKGGEKEEEEDDLIDRLWATMGPLLFPIPFVVASIPFALAAIPISFYTPLNDSFTDS